VTQEPWRQGHLRRLWELLGRRLGVVAQSPIVPLIGVVSAILVVNTFATRIIGIGMPNATLLCQQWREHIGVHAVGTEAAALAAASRLLQAGFYVPAIRPPTVPSGSSRYSCSNTVDCRKIETEAWQAHCRGCCCCTLLDCLRAVLA
jgi:7-keto-8-aminopelargonate synthetase-like enzyme